MNKIQRLLNLDKHYSKYDTMPSIIGMALYQNYRAIPTMCKKVGQNIKLDNYDNYIYIYIYMYVCIKCQN